MTKQKNNLKTLIQNPIKDSIKNSFKVSIKNPIKNPIKTVLKHKNVCNSLANNLFTTILISFVVSMILLAVLSIVLGFVEGPGRFISLCSNLTFGMGMFTGGFYLAKFQKTKGWLYGLIGSGSYFFVLAVISPFVFGKFMIDISLLLKIVAGLFLGVIGGICGINWSSQKSSQKRPRSIYVK